MSNGLTHALKGTRLFRRALTAVVLASLLLLSLTAGFNRTVHAAGGVSLNTIGVAATQNFNTLPASGSATWTNDSTIPGWYHARTGTGTTIVANDGSSNAGNLYSYGTGTNTDRALGSVGSGGATAGNFFWGVILTNNTGGPVTALTVSYTGEEWRNSAAAAQTVAFSYLTGASLTGSLADFQAAGTNVTQLDFTSPVTGGTAGALDGNAAANRTAKSFTITGLNLANGAQILLRWSDPDHTGNDHGLSIDDFSVTPLGGPIGTTGVRTTDIQGTDDGGYALALQPDGRVVVGGYAVNVSGNKDFALVRYNYNGTLDTTFGTNGKVVTDFNGTSDRIWGITLQTDGKIVAVGETISSVFPGTNDIAVARYTTAGALDTTFGGTGKVTTDHGAGANNSAYAVTMSGTNIIVAGVETVSGNNDFMVARYTTAGVLDATFGALGVTTLGFSGGNDVARAVAIDGTGNIVLGGYANNGSDDDFAVARFTSAGVLDTTFVAGAGKAAVNIFSPGSADQAFALVIDSTQRIILAGSAYNPSTGNKDFALVCYLSTGALDTTGFGPAATGGIVTTDFVNSPDVANAVYVRSDGFIVAGGFSRYSASSDDFAIARYTANGSLDTTLDGDGKLTMRISNADERVYGIAREFDGKIVAAGFATTANSNPVQHDFALARFNPDGSLDATNPTSLTSPDLLLTKTFNPDSVVVGQNCNAAVGVTNRGPGNATNVVITDTIPAGLTIGTIVNSAGTVQVSGQTVTNTVGSLAAGQSATLTVTLTTTQVGTFINTASVTSTETDLSPSNNTDSASLRVTNPSGVKDLSFSPSTVTGGCQNSTGTITLTDPATGNGALVNISSADPSAASAPASVLVPAGQSSVQFNVTTGPVQANKTVRFEAILGPTSFVRRLVVNAGQCN
jgi:uncharacterized delta-60 repeat protein/uncharacterized repeat protein (TIGR01451 family)